MRTFSLESAQEYLGDPQATRRGYLSAEILEDAQKLAHAVVQMPTFGKLGCLGEIGSPEQWWCDNCHGYAEITGKYNNRQFSVLIRLAEEMVCQDRRDAVESRWQALEVIKKSFGLSKEEQREYNSLTEYLKS